MRGRLKNEVLRDPRFASVLDSLTERTKRDWTVNLRRFESFCNQYALRPFPATGQTVLEYARHYAHGRKFSTVAAQLDAISYVHRMHGASDPTKHADIADFMLRLRREKPPTSAPPVSTVDLREMVAHLAGRALLDIRDRAIVLVMFFGMLPRSAISSLAFADVNFDDDGMSLKADGRAVYVGAAGDKSICPVGALRAYIGVRGNHDGPLFSAMTDRGAFADRPLDPNYVSNLIHDNARRALAGQGRMSSALRRGFILELAAADVKTSYIMRQAGYKKFDSLTKQTGFVGHPFKMSVEARKLLRSSRLTKRRPGAGL